MDNKTRESMLSSIANVMGPMGVTEVTVDGKTLLTIPAREEPAEEFAFTNRTFKKDEHILYVTVDEDGLIEGPCDTHLTWWGPSEEGKFSLPTYNVSTEGSMLSNNPKSGWNRIFVHRDEVGEDVLWGYGDIVRVGDIIDIDEPVVTFEKQKRGVRTQKKIITFKKIRQNAKIASFKITHGRGPFSGTERPLYYRVQFENANPITIDYRYQITRADGDGKDCHRLALPLSVSPDSEIVGYGDDVALGDTIHLSQIVDFTNPSLSGHYYCNEYVGVLHWIKRHETFHEFFFDDGRHYETFPLNLVTHFTDGDYQIYSSKIKKLN